MRQERYYTHVWTIIEGHTLTIMEVQFIVDKIPVYSACHRELKSRLPPVFKESWVLVFFSICL